MATFFYFLMNMQKDFFRESTLYAHHISFEKIIEQAHNFVQSEHADLRIFLFASEENPINRFMEGGDNEFSIQNLYSQKDIFIGRLRREYGRVERKSVEGRFVLFQYRTHNIFVVITDESTEFVKHGLLRFIHNQYPFFSLPFLYSWEMEMLLNNLQKQKPSHQIRLTKVLRKSRLKEDSRKYKESDLTWTDLPYVEVFKEARNNDAWVEKLYFDLTFKRKDAGEKEKEKTVFRGFISRDGVFKCNGDFKLVFNTIVEPSIEMFLLKNQKFSNRARVEETNFCSKPLVLQFEEPIFKHTEQNWRLLGVLKKLGHSANSVIHANPYLHVSLMDYIDNSSYDIWVLSDSRITIAPQTVCSISSLNRLCDHISKEFHEGEIKDFEELQDEF